MKLVAISAAVVLGLLGAVFGSWAGWHTTGPLASTGAAADIAADAFPGAETGTPSRHDVLFSFASAESDSAVGLLGGDGYYAGTVDVPLALGPVSDEAARHVATAAQRLRSSGRAVA